MNKRNLQLLLLLISWTVSFAQTPGSNPVSKDSLRCYTPTELKAIAHQLINGKECDTLFKIARLQITVRDTIIASQNRTIKLQDTRQETSKNLVKELDLKIEGLKDENKNLKTKLILNKIGWAVTSVGLGIITVLSIIR